MKTITPFIIGVSTAFAGLADAAPTVSADAFNGLGGRQELYRGGVEVIPSDNGEVTREFAEGRVFEDRNRNGKLDRGERGLPRVRVSNGYDVALTDHRGYYKLPAKSRGLNAFTLFVTKPAGFELPVNEDNVPQFSYHHIPNGSPELRFGGLPASGPQPKAVNFPMVRGPYKKRFKIAVSGDTQPYSNNEVGYVRDSLAAELAAREDLELVMIEGDIIGDDLGLYPRLKKTMSVAGVPVYLTPGNHDIDNDATSDKHSLDTFKREWGPAYYSFEVGDVHFVVLDNVRYPCTPESDNADGKHDYCDNPATAPTYNGVIDEAQVEWLANDIAATSEHKLIVLNMHIPLVSFSDMGSTKHQTDNVAWLYELLQGRPALALAGHTHNLENIVAGEFYQGWDEAVGAGPTPIPHIITGATAGSWWSGDFDDNNLPMSIQRMGAPRGYMLFEFKGSQFTSTFKAAGKGPQEQMSVDFLSPTFMNWYQSLKEWALTPEGSRSPTPPLNLNDLPDTSILTDADFAGGVSAIINVWNGSKNTQVWTHIDDGPLVEAVRTQSGTGEGKSNSLDPFALKKQMYVYRYAARSESGEERAQGFELFNGSRFGVADPQPSGASMWTESSNHIWSVAIPADLEQGAHILRVIVSDGYGQIFTSVKAFEVMDERPAPYFRKEVFE
ncbi:phosphohydrolase [Hahella sp. KA22]|uniref:calcineurin-like phosphoesterase C-terminal domain-containing protein n=1 Tax=Hahella sp. KA22 TaxID=1628392 RepID=UPI000FDD2D8D|nr:calcineurin-like phosphoesterase C-terminal domain-containing protein [Hahella sp. KA22]AZZ94122.1 phosphohydrolase [Hahella sp. KA22]QAY57496.1 phosphohydrolase [Hahella sp. KA22]